jgi:RIO-like serine/threonine protein kinase
MGRERRALAHLADAHIEGIPRLLAADRDTLARAWIEGAPMHQARPHHPAYFRAALRLLRQLHAAGVIHNDLAKETNWLVTPGGLPALVDFQLASVVRRRGALARARGHDDLRHLLKHKRTYLPDGLTAREKRILARPSLPSRAWRATGKKVYLFVTRRLLHWRDREGAGDRTHE